LTGVDYIKLVLVLLIFLGAGPLLGVALKGRPAWQRWAFALMCFMTINGLLGPGNWGLTIGSIETYRGHTKGYHFYFNHALAIALVVARRLEDRKSFRWLPPGLGWYLAYCGCSLVSLVSAADKNLVLMTAHKSVFASLLVIATFNLLRTEEDLQFFLRVMVGVMLWQLCVCLKLKYLEGMYQVRGTFEHQNPLAMYTVLIGMPFLAVALGPSFKGANLLLLGFLACAVIVQATVSRAALAVFGAGTMAVTVLSLLEKPTARRVLTTATLGVVGTAGLLMTLDTILARFHDQGNQASAELRDVMKEACREMVKDHPLGIGWNNYALAVNPPFRYAEIYYQWIRGRGMPVDEAKANSVVESHYYLLLAENGYPGLLGWLLLVGVALWRNLRAYHFFGHSFLRCLSLGLGMGCALNYAQSTLERVLTQPRNLMLWLIILAITGRIEILRRTAKTLRRAPTPVVP
jgi:hypothetical protein